MNYRIIATVLLIAVLSAAFIVVNQGPAAQNSTTNHPTVSSQPVDPAAPTPDNSALTSMKIN